MTHWEIADNLLVRREMLQREPGLIIIFRREVAVLAEAVPGENHERLCHRPVFPVCHVLAVRPVALVLDVRKQEIHRHADSVAIGRLECKEVTIRSGKSLTYTHHGIQIEDGIAV